MSNTEAMRTEFMAWVRDRGCDTDGAWSAWQAASAGKAELLEAAEVVLFEAETATSEYDGRSFDYCTSCGANNLSKPVIVHKPRCAWKNLRSAISRATGEQDADVVAIPLLTNPAAPHQKVSGSPWQHDHSCYENLPAEGGGSDGR